jgi:hypothetical protein
MTNFYYKIRTAVFSFAAVAMLVCVMAGNASAQLVTIGTGTTTNATTAAGPINEYYRSMHYQAVYTPTEIGAIASGSEVNTIALYITGAPLYALPNFSIKMANVSQTNMSTAYAGAMTTVYTDASYTSAEMTLNAWNTLTLSTPFVWTGGSLLVDWCFDQVSPTYNASGVVRIFTPTATPGSRYIRSDAASQCGSTPSLTVTAKAQVQLNFAAPVPCSGTPNAGTATGPSSTCGTAALSASGLTLGGGMQYQWQVSTDGGATWNNLEQHRRRYRIELHRHAIADLVVSIDKHVCQQRTHKHDQRGVGNTKHVHRLLLFIGTIYGSR